MRNYLYKGNNVVARHVYRLYRGVRDPGGKLFCARPMAGMVLLVLLSACSSMQSISTAINAYQRQAGQVELGQSKEQVLTLLSPTQANLSPKQSKPSEEYIKDGKRTEIYFFRSRSFADGLVTDDEFTPYVFEDGELVAIGWTSIGGPKTQAQNRDRDNYHYHHGVFLHY